MLRKWAKSGPKIGFWKIWSLIYLKLGLWWKCKFGSWGMYQNALDQTYCRIFKSNVSLEQNDEVAWFFACWYKIMEFKSWLKNIWWGVVKNGCGHSDHMTLKLAVSQEGIDGINGFFWLLIHIQER